MGQNIYDRLEIFFHGPNKKRKARKDVAMKHTKQRHEADACLNYHNLNV